MKLSAIISNLIDVRGAIAHCATIILLICAAPTAQAEIYGSGTFLVGEGPVYSGYGSYVGALVKNGSGSLSLGYASGSITFSAGSLNISTGVYTGGVLVYTGTSADPGIISSSFTVDISATHGTVTKLPNLITYNYGARVELTAVADEGYLFTGWTNHNASFSNQQNLSINVYSNFNLVANFVPISRVISLSAAGLDWESQIVVGESSVRSFTITNNGNSLLNISRIIFPNGYSGSFSGSIMPNASTTVQVTFFPTTAGTFAGNIVVESDATSGANTLPVSAVGASTHTLTGSAVLSQFDFFQKPIDTGDGLIIHPAISIFMSDLHTSKVQRTYWAGSIVNLQAVPIAGYVFKNWTENDQIVSASPQFDLTIGRDQNLIANYETESRGVGVIGNTKFGPHNLGSYSRKIVYLRNFGNTPAFVSGLKINQGKGKKAAFKGNWSGWIPANGYQRVNFRFKPTEYRRYVGEIDVKTESKTFEVINPELTGTGK